MTDRLVGLVRQGVRVYDLARPMFVGMPQSPNHPRYYHAFPRRHGDHIRPDGGSAANDLLFTGTHVGTHIDALAHVSQDGKLFGGADALASEGSIQFPDHGVHTIAPMVRRGLLLDVPGYLALDACEPGREITPDELDATAKCQGVTVEPGDVLLIRSGWGNRFADGAQAYLGHDTGVPGVGEKGAYWLAEHGIHAAGADSIAFERLAPGDGHSVLPAHRVLLVEAGIYIIEALALDELARDRVYEFVFVLAPLHLVGATGSPVRPLAVASDA
jgi:kynurenine formamidase